MTQKHIGILILIFMALLLCACGGEKYEPFAPLSKATVSPERDAAVQSALNSGESSGPKPAAPAAEPTEEPETVPTFDENSFFSEIDPEPTAKPKKKAQPTATFEPVPTAKPKKKAQPTATFEPVPTVRPKNQPYDPNIMMYGRDSEGRTTYTLQEGEDLICLGRRFDVSLKQLLTLNGLSAPEEAGTGTVITLPNDAEPWSLVDGYGKRRLNPHPAVVNPRPDDSIFSLACTFGDVRPEDIAVANQLVLGEPIPSGMQVTIP